jgi:hypothetical protein
VSRDLAEVLPLEDAKALDEPKPVFVDGKAMFEPAKVARRREAMVERALRSDAVAVIILGGGHDLTDAVRDRLIARAHGDRPRN